MIRVAIALVVFAALAAVHYPYLHLPYFWDELGQFIPASLDIFQTGDWVPVTTSPNIHPPGVMVYLASVWKIFGGEHSILATRLAMLAMAAFGVLGSFLLAIRLGRGTPGYPALGGRGNAAGVAALLRAIDAGTTRHACDGIFRLGALPVSGIAIWMVRRRLSRLGDVQGNWRDLARDVRRLARAA